MTREKLAIGNWKMNGALAMVDQLHLIGEAAKTITARTVICPPSLYVSPFAMAHEAVAIGAQDCHMAKSGAHTGDVSAAMIAELGGSFVIVGHSERRADHGESDAQVAAKAQAALDAGLRPIICVGETEAQRDAGDALGVVEKQIIGSTAGLRSVAQCILAYEPVWAIGTGRVPTSDQIAEMFAHIDQVLANLTDGAAMPRLYGGSVKGANAAEIFAISGVDGALVGGASLKADDFIPIMTALG